MRSSSSSASISATSVGATIAARHTASHSGMHGKNQQCRQRAEHERQRNSDDEQPERDASAAHHPTELELGGLVEQDDRQRQLGDAP